jgi:hypothetical protein
MRNETDRDYQLSAGEVALMLGSFTTLIASAGLLTTL